MKQLANLKNTFAIMSAVVLLGSCMKNDDPIAPTPVARVLIFNAYSPITSTVVRANDSTPFSIPYSEILSFFDFPTVTGQTMTFINQPTNQILVDRAALRLELNKVYSGYVFGNAVPAKFILLNDSLLANPSTNPRIRFLNLAEGVDAVDLFIGDEKIESLSNRNPEVQANANQTERFVLSSRAAGAANITVRDLQGNILVTVPSYNFIAAGHHTIILLGDHAFNSESPNIPDRAKALKVRTFIY